MADGGPSEAEVSEPGGRDGERSAASLSRGASQGNEDPPSVKERWFTRERGAWIGAGGTVLAALIAVAALYLPQPGNDEESAAPAQGAGRTTSPQQPSPGSGPGSPTGSVATDRPSAGSPGSAVRWQGRILFDGSSRDLDAVPPGKAATGRGDIATGGADIVEVQALLGSVVALWEGEGMPDHGDCAAMVETEGMSSHPLEQDTVLCVRTGEGHIARLRVSSFPENYGPFVKFDAVIWTPSDA